MDIISLDYTHYYIYITFVIEGLTFVYSYIIIYVYSKERWIVLSAKMGRPTDNPKTEIIKIRATKQDREKLLYCCEKTNKTQYEIVMRGISKVYDELTK